MTRAHQIVPWRTGDDAACEKILRSIPGWFGIEESLVRYARETATIPTWLALENEKPIGFVSLKQHFPGSVEVACIAVGAGRHRAGIGRALVDRAQAWAREHGCTMLFVKTMGPSKPNREYAETLKFYLATGFVPLEEFRKEWGALPCLVLAKPLRSAGP